MRTCSWCKNVFGNNVGGVSGGIGGEGGWCCSDSCRSAYLQSRRSSNGGSSSGGGSSADAVVYLFAIIIGAVVFIYNWIKVHIGPIVAAVIGFLKSLLWYFFVCGIILFAIFFIYKSAIFFLRRKKNSPSNNNKINDNRDIHFVSNSDSKPCSDITIYGKDNIASISQNSTFNNAYNALDKKIEELYNSFMDNPSSVDGARKIAELYEQKEEIDSAIEWYHYVLSMTGGSDPSIIRKIGTLQLCQIEPAIKAREDIIASTPDVPEATRYREELVELNRQKSEILKTGLIAS